MSAIMGGIFKDLPPTIRGEDLCISCLMGCSGTGSQKTYSTWQEERKGSGDIGLVLFLFSQRMALYVRCHESFH